MIDGEENEEKVNNEETKEKSYFDRNEDTRSIFRIKQKRPANYKKFIVYRGIYISVMFFVLTSVQFAKYSLHQIYGTLARNMEIYDFVLIVEIAAWSAVACIPTIGIVYFLKTRDYPINEEKMYYISSMIKDGVILVLALTVVNFIFGIL